MYKHLVMVLALSSLCCFLYGILNICFVVEKNACQMTYMYQVPTFIKIHVDGGENFPKYNLYTYAEGRLIENARSQRFNGAPVIFVPGNSGSYKQGRSLGSTALRKGIDHDLNYHLDYFLVDYNEEFSALFGGYLISQKEFLKKCIFAVLKLYKNLPNAPTQVVLIGHSMGGKVAQSLLADLTVADMINTIIFIATPIDRPVINFDVYMEAAYRDTNNFLLSERRVISFKNDTNYCTSIYANIAPASPEDRKSLDDKLLISIGGGKRDLLVHEGLTYSKFSDINVMASAIPNVWLSTDHVASVWCLQLVLVINRFLFSIISSPGNRHNKVLSFVQNKSELLKKASYYFVAPTSHSKRRNVNLITDEYVDEWFEESRRVFSKDFKNGLNYTHFQMVPLIDKRQYKKLYSDTINLESEDWVFGCEAKEFKRNLRYCSTGYSISHHVQKLPNSHQQRMFVSIDLHKIKKSYPNWTHIVLRIPPTKSNVKLNVDIHDPEERTLNIKTLKWFWNTEKQLLSDSTLGASHYKILVSDLDESYQSIDFYIKARICSKPTHNAVAKTCVPWAMGFDRYQNFSESENKPLSVNVPMPKPLGYNSTQNSVIVNLYLDPNCRYQISYRNSFGGSLSRIVQQYAHWLPAHLTAVLLLSFKYQVSLTPHRAPFKCAKPLSGILHCGSFFLITATRIFAKLLQSVKYLPEPDNFHRSMVISFIIHGSASAVILLSTACMWAFVAFCGNSMHRVFLRLTKLSTLELSIVLPIIDRFPLLAGVTLIAIAFASCGGIALILGLIVYFLLISKQYEDYLEKFVFDTVARISSKLSAKRGPDDEDDNLMNAEENIPANTGKELLNFITEDNTVSETEALFIRHKEGEDNSVVNTPEKPDTEHNEQDEELEWLLNEAIQKQNEVLIEKQKKKKLERKEYDGIHKGLIKVHFHITLFLLTCVLSILFIPTTISWARDFRYSNSLSMDPSIIPATIVLSCVCLLWQFEAPRNLFAYNFVASISYICAAISIIYCQDSVYRLSGVISTVFVMVTAHQLFSSAKTDDADFDPVEAELENRIKQMKTVLVDSGTNFKKIS